MSESGAIAGLNGGALIVPSISVRCAGREGLLSSLRRSPRRSHVFVPGAHRLRVGERVCVDFNLDDDHLHLQRPGVVSWTRSVEKPGAPQGAGILLAEDGYASRLATIVSDTEGRELIPRARRYHVAMAAYYAIVGRRIPGVVCDISRSGLFLLTIKLVEPGTIIHVTLKPRPNTRIRLRAEVVRVRTSPSRGLALRFTAPPARRPRAFRTLLDEIARAAAR